MIEPIPFMLTMPLSLLCHSINTNHGMWSLSPQYSATATLNILAHSILFLPVRNEIHFRFPKCTAFCHFCAYEFLNDFRTDCLAMFCPITSTCYLQSNYSLFVCFCHFICDVQVSLHVKSDYSKVRSRRFMVHLITMQSIVFRSTKRRTSVMPGIL